MCPYSKSKGATHHECMRSPQHLTEASEGALKQLQDWVWAPEDEHTAEANGVSQTHICAAVQ